MLEGSLAMKVRGSYSQRRVFFAVTPFASGWAGLISITESSGAMDEGRRITEERMDCSQSSPKSKLTLPGGRCVPADLQRSSGMLLSPVPGFVGDLDLNEVTIEGQASYTKVNHCLQVRQRHGRCTIEHR